MLSAATPNARRIWAARRRITGTLWLWRGSDTDISSRGDGSDGWWAPPRRPAVGAAQDLVLDVAEEDLEPVGGVAERDRLVEHHGGLAVHACREASRDRLGDPGEVGIGRRRGRGSCRRDLRTRRRRRGRPGSRRRRLVQAANRSTASWVVSTDSSWRTEASASRAPAAAATWSGDATGCDSVAEAARSSPTRGRARAGAGPPGRRGRGQVARHLAEDAEAHRRRLAGRGLGQGAALERAHLAEAGFGERQGALADRPDGQGRKEARPVEVQPEDVFTAGPAAEARAVSAASTASRTRDSSIV